MFNSRLLVRTLLCLSLLSFILPVDAFAQAAASPAVPVEASDTMRKTEPPTQAPRRREKRPASRGARAELASVQALIGAAAGAELCGIAECDQARAWAGTVLLGAGAGVTLSLLTTRDGIPQGRAQAVNSGGIFGTWLGVGGALALGDSDPNPQAIAAVVLGGQALGTGLGLLADNTFTLTAGEVSLANSGALWTGVTSLLSLAAIEPDSDGDELRRRFFGTTLVTTSLGLVGGAWLARRDHVSRGRALMVDLGALTGGGMLPLIGWFVRGDSATSEGLLWSSVAGTLGGAITAYVLTREWDAPEVPNLSMSFSPTQGGGVAQLSLKL